MHVLVKGEERETETDTEREEGSDTVGAWVNINKREKREKRLQTKERRGKKRLHTKRHKQNCPTLLYFLHHKLPPPPSLPSSLPLSLPPYLISQCSCCARFSSCCDTLHPRVQKCVALSHTSLAPCSPVCTGGHICSWGDRG